MADEWRTEADEAWLARHRSTTFERLRRRFASFLGLGDAISNAELGPFGGAPRKPELKIGKKGYAVVRVAPQHVTYTATQIDPDVCRRCGQELAERHRIDYMQSDQERVPVGSVRMCRDCHSESWLFRSRMPAAGRARSVARKVVL